MKCSTLVKRDKCSYARKVARVQRSTVFNPSRHLWLCGSVQQRGRGVYITRNTMGLDNSRDTDRQTRLSRVREGEGALIYHRCAMTEPQCVGSLRALDYKLTYSALLYWHAMDAVH